MKLRGVFQSTERALFFTVCVLALCALCPGIAPAQYSNEVTISYLSPEPGANFVSTQTNIILRTSVPVNPFNVLQPELFSVRGSLSANHAGKTILSDDQRTVLFLADKPFMSGETVTVVLQRGILTGTGISGNPMRFSFTTSQAQPPSPAHQFSNEDDPLSSLREGGGTTSPQFQKYQSATVLSDTLPGDFPRPSIIADNSPSAGKIFLGTFVFGGTLTDPSYLLMLENSGQPAFYRKLPFRGLDFTIQPNGYLTYYDYHSKSYIELDSTYAIIDTIRGGNGYTADAHDLLLLPNGHALLMAYDNQTVDMSTIVAGGNPSATVIGLIIQELDRNKNVIFQWRSWDHFKITDATLVDFKAATVDYVHGNALDIDPDGNILLSSRHLDEITKINRETGALLWRLGGKNNQFTYLYDTEAFSHQHAVRRLQNGNITLFDNGNGKSPQYSRAAEYKLDETAKTAELVWEYRHSPDVYGSALGYVQRLANGNTLIGWGATSPAFTEVRPDGSTALEIKLPDGVVSYRAYRFQWDVGQVITSITDTNLPPGSFALAQNYPNPFNPSTTIQFSLPHAAEVSLKIFNMLGEEIGIIATGELSAGRHAVSWDGKNFPSGIYFYKLAADNFTEIKKMVLMK